MIAERGYRWVILGLGFANQGLSYPTWYVFPAFFVALIEEFGWARGPAAGVFSLFVLLTGIAAPFVGRLTDRWGPRMVITLGAAVLGLALAGCSSVTELWQFYLFYGLVGGIGMSLSGWISNVTLLSRWFPRSIGAASGFTSAGIGMAILVLTPVTQARITTVGWRQAYMELALLTVLGIIPANLLLQRSPPRQASEEARAHAARLAPDDRQPAAPRAGGRPGRRPRLGRVWTLGLAAQTTRFWLLFVAFFAAAIAVQFVFVHQVAFLVEGGVERPLAAFSAGLIGLTSIPTKLVGGLVSDRIGRELTWAIFMAALAIGLAMLVLTGTGPYPELAYVFPLFVGVGYSGMSILTPAMVADIFRGPNFGAVFGAIAASTGLGAASGAWIAGTIYDLTGSYMSAFALAAVCCVVSAACGWLAAPRLVRRPPGAPSSRLATPVAHVTARL